MTTDRQIELIDELAGKCCRYHDIHKSCMGCWRRTNGCEKFILLNKLVEEDCRIVPQGEWLQTENYYAYKCSRCDAITRQPNDNYCPNCGARMMEE